MRVLLILLCAAGMAATGSVLASESRPACVDRSADGPWYTVGKKIPAEADLTRAFRSGGEKALRSLLGDPIRETPQEVVWAYEWRREYSQTTCNPPSHRVEYNQSFPILRVHRGEGGATCEVEAKEFIGEAIITPLEALDRPRTPLGATPRTCGAPKASHGQY